MQHPGSKGFTLVEIVVVLTILSVLFGFSVVFYNSSIGRSNLKTSAEELLHNTRRAQQYSMTGFRNGSWGVYLDTSVSPQRYVLFKGNSYSGRDQNFDELYVLPGAITFSAIGLNGGGNEVLFTKPSGSTTNTGTITLRNAEMQTINVQINSAGMVTAAQSGGQPQTSTFSASADSYMYKFSTSSNYGSDTKIWAQTWSTSYHERGIIRFNLSSISVGSTVTSAKLKLFLYNTQGTSRTYGVHKITQSPVRDWSEGSVTWNAYASGTNWSSAGGDFAASATDTKSAGSWGGVGYWVEWTVTSDVQDFVSNAATNFGWVLKDAAEGATPQYYVWFASKEYSDSSKRPVLEVSYQ